ncbi:hypothetical protein ACHAPQ_002158 [Fusarium lateritium]
MSIACETCRTQARTVLRAAMRAGASRAAASNTRNFLPPVAVAARRQFSSTGQRSLLKGIGKSMAEPYRVLGATEQLFKASSKAADYHITEEARKNDKVELAKDGEEIGESLDPDNVWHQTFKLPPTFSTWSHVTMLHLYLINARIRCFDREGFQNWQHQLTDHFFFECEKKMHIDHHITSSALRQRYLKDIFVQWRGLLLAYDEGLIKGDAMLASAIWRNLFKGSPDADPRALLAIVGWMRWTLRRFEAVPDNDLPAELPGIMAQPVDMFWTTLKKQLGRQEEDDVPVAEPVKEAATVPTGETPKASTN